MAWVDQNDLAFWFPPIRDAGLPVPRTEIVQTEADLLSALDGERPEEWDSFIEELEVASKGFATPFFLRTGHTSGKHDWKQTCLVDWGDSLGSHVVALVEYSALAGLFRLPTTWAIRELIPTAPICRCARYQGMPVVREFRLFIRDDEVEHTQPYWPVDAVEEGRPDIPDWRPKLTEISTLSSDDNDRLGYLAGMASSALGGGYWSVDFLADKDGKWWLTDMALGEESFRYEPEGLFTERGGYRDTERAA